ncbi:MAG TPA: cbb3-type cytochrome c oxidase subunit I [Solirubrobacterales bacterium]|nr:cbb3-type cytochrome c oxidase subunit I [Solirubrobacterales bacterium]
MTPPPTAISPARPEVVTDGYSDQRPAWVKLATSGDHKAVGVLYIAAALSFLVLAVFELVLMRVQLIVPDNTMISAEIFDQLLSAYGATAVVLFGVPLALGLMGYVVPLQIGARATAFPRLGALSFWLYLAGGITLYASFLYRPPDAGTNPLPPLSDTVFSPTAGVDAWIVGVGLATLGFVVFAINLLATIHTQRAPGMAWRRMPLFSWAAAVGGYVVVVTGAVMVAACAMLLIDRQFDGVFFDAGEGGSPILWQHLSWFFFTGAYVVILLFAFGAISEILPTFSGKPIFSHRTIVGSLIAVGVLGPLAWMQNMYTAPIPVGWTYFAMTAAVALTVPIGLLIFNWLATIWRGALRLRSPLLFALGAISTMAFGLAGELTYSVIPVGWLLDSTTVAQADTYYALVGGAVFGGFAALYYWFPKLTGRLMGEGLARASFLTILVGVHLMAIGMALAGLDGQPVDVYRYYEGDDLGAYNLVASIGAFVLAGGILLTLGNAAYSARRGVRAGADPWRGSTLEWFALSPPPPHNYDVIPDVRGAEPLRDIREAVERRSEVSERPQAEPARQAGPPVA